MSERRTRSGGAAQRSEIRTPRTKPSKRLQRKSGSDLPNILPEIWPKASHSVPLRKTIVLKKIVAHSVEAPALHTLRRSPRISFKLEKENSPPLTVATEEELLKICAVPGASANTLVLRTENVESNSGEGELDARDLEMSQKVRRSYSRLGSSTSASTSTPGRRSFPGLQGPEALQGLSPVVGSKLIKIPDEPAKPMVPDTTLPGISPPVTKVKRKKVPEILKSELDEWAMAMNAEFEAAEQFDLLIE
ncbi:sororin [Psammomys obesus]|uniref:sororin n=1 Tax=Psammomys obesus TaxID=48139 RepID=UPI0024528E36|nr:sororin [Psammomys obesus]